MKHTLETLSALELHIIALDKSVGLQLSTKNALDEAISIEREKLKPINNPMKTIDDFHNKLNSWYIHKPDCFCSDCGN